MYRKLLKDCVYKNIANEISRLSKDENTKVGAIIISKEGFPVSWGYNGAISTFDDNIIPYSRETSKLSYSINGEIKTIYSNKYPFMEHAESNAIYFADKNKLNDSTIYVTAIPCHKCAMKIAKNGIRRVVVNNMVATTDSTIGNDQDLTYFIFSQHKIQLVIDNINVELMPVKTDE